MKQTRQINDTVYYRDELNDDFAGIKRAPKFIADDYRYINDNVFFKIARFFVYRVVMTPFAFIYMKLKFHHKVVNKSILKPFRKRGYFLYGNHTQIQGDAYIPNVICAPKDVYEIVHSDNMAVKGTENIMKMLGAIPLPSTIHGMTNFMSAVEKRSLQHNVIVIYPEAHLWPYYTGIRNFKAVSFKYPVRLDDPSFCMTTCYKKRRFGKKPRLVTYVDGPFYPDLSISERERHIDLRNRIYNTMVERAKTESTYVTIKYVKDPRSESND